MRREILHDAVDARRHSRELFSAIIILTNAGSLAAQRVQALSPPPVAGISCDAMEGQRIHIHQHLLILDKGKPVPVPPDVGRPSGAQCLYWLHTHTPDGVIHIESPANRTFTLGDFFAVWGQPLNTTRAASAVTKSAKNFKVWVDGKPYAEIRQRSRSPRTPTSSSRSARPSRPRPSSPNGTPDRALAQRSVRGQNRPQEHVRAVGDVRGPREFLGRMADAADARDEDHADRPELRHRLRVVARAARHHAARQAERRRRVADDLAHARIGGRRRRSRGARTNANVVPFIAPIVSALLADAREQRVDLGVVEVAQLERADDFARE